jgi:hypothetical protein
MTKTKDENSTVKSKESKKLGRPKAKKTRLVVPDEVYRKIARISEESRMPMVQVYEDALLNGIYSLTLEGGMYYELIELRKARNESISKNESFTRVVQERKPGRSQATEPGEPSEPAYSARPLEFEPGPTENGSDLAPVERGLGPQDEADLESDLSYEREP